MKRFIAAVSALIMSFFVLAGCGGSATGGAERAEPLISAESIDENLRFFLGVTDKNLDGDIGDRAPTSESERAAAQRIYDRYADKERYGNLKVTSLDAETSKFEVNVSTGNMQNPTEKRSSQNVVIRLPAPENGQGRQVIISTGYDNSFGKYSAEYDGNRPATGAYDNATGVAVVMSLIDYCSENAGTLFEKIDFDLVFVFFGCSSYNSLGAEAYMDKGMTSHERLNTLMMLNIDRMGGERMYLYTDEVSTPHEKFIRSVANDAGSVYHTLPDNMPIINGMYIDGVYYAHFAMLESHSVFIEHGIPAAYLFSGYYGGFNLSDLEKKGSANLGGTENDTYANLVSKRGDYARQGSDTASLVARSLTADGFVEAATAARTETYDYSFWVKPLWAYLIVIFVIIALCVVLIILVKYVEKKHPFVPIVRRMKIAVFGMEYETKSEEDIFVDIQRRPKNPFDGY